MSIAAPHDSTCHVDGVPAAVFKIDSRLVYQKCARLLLCPKKECAVWFFVVYTNKVECGGIRSNILTGMPRSQGRANIIDADRARAIGYLQAQVTASGELKYGAVAVAARLYMYHRNTASAVWAAREAPAGDSNESRGRPPKLSKSDVAGRIEACPLRQRTTVRAASAATGIPRSTLQRHITTTGGLKRVSSHVKPSLKHAQKLARVAFALSLVERPIGMFVSRERAERTVRSGTNRHVYRIAHAQALRRRALSGLLSASAKGRSVPWKLLTKCLRDAEVTCIEVLLYDCQRSLLNPMTRHLLLARSHKQDLPSNSTSTSYQRRGRAPASGRRRV
ncbi:hypothetical protein PybrP1_007778 [[Pythium] brassicae (nom. inval.)]|nr:hypothetical protein PybrP1_007778 [[Pythium] brassicae (nom. inval.)]